MRRNIALAIGAAQSTELGFGKVENGGADALQRSYAGPPVSDPIAPNGSGGSRWPLLSSRMALERDIHMRFVNAAFGSTSITNKGITTSDNWCGDPALFDRDSGLLDAAGTNNLLRANVVKTGLDAISKHWEKWVYVSIGQRDGGQGETLANFRDGYICYVNWCLNQGYKVIVAFTLSAPNLNAWMTDVGSPAVKQVIEHFADNPNVFEGANLHDLGIGPTYDGFHPYSVTLQDMADADYNALVNNAGW